MWGNNCNNVNNTKKCINCPNINSLHFHWIDFVEWEECASSFGCYCYNLSSKLGVFLFHCTVCRCSIIFFLFVCWNLHYYIFFAQSYFFLLLTLCNSSQAKKKFKRAKSSSSLSLFFCCAEREQSFILLKLKCTFIYEKNYKKEEATSIDGIF